MRPRMLLFFSAEIAGAAPPCPIKVTPLGSPLGFEMPPITRFFILDTPNPPSKNPYN